MRIKLKKSNETIEHYGKRIMQLANYTFICDDEEYQRAKDWDVILVKFEDSSKVPKGWIKQGNELGYNPYIYFVRKNMILEIE